MKLHELVPPKGSRRPKQRIGRGMGAGQGKTSGKGQKGQKSRTGSSIPRTFEGGQLPLTQRLPKLRGFHNKWRQEYAAVNLGKLSRFEKGSTVDLAALIKAGVVRSNTKRAKLLAAGTLEHALTIRIDKASVAARAAVEALGGTVEVTEEPKTRRVRKAKKAKSAPPVEAKEENKAKAKAKGKAKPSAEPEAPETEEPAGDAEEQDGSAETEA